MNRVKKILGRLFLWLVLIGLSVYLFRGWIYRHTVSYHVLGERQNYNVKDTLLANSINALADNEMEVRHIIHKSLSFTARSLTYRIHRTSNDPNTLIHTRHAHCVGYAAYCAIVLNTLLAKKDRSKEWQAQPKVARLYLLGINIHSFLQSPFFKDHDIVLIKNKTTGEVVAIDPTLYDYLDIEEVTLAKK